MVVIVPLNQRHLDMVSCKPMLTLKAPVNACQLGSRCSCTGEGHPIGSPKQWPVQRQEEGGVNGAPKLLKGSCACTLGVDQCDVVAKTCVKTCFPNKLPILNQDLEARSGRLVELRGSR